MKINITEKGDGTFGLFFDGDEIPLSAQDLKTLLVQITQLLAPDSAIAREADARNQRFLGRVKEASDVDVQLFIQAADHDDVVVLLKAAETDSAVEDKLFKNMSDVSRKIFIEDRDFRFKEAVPKSQIASAFERLNRVADDIRSKGRTDL